MDVKTVAYVPYRYWYIEKHYGNAFVTKLMFNKLVFGKGIKWRDVSNVKCIVHEDN